VKALWAGCDVSSFRPGHSISDPLVQAHLFSDEGNNAALLRVYLTDQRRGDQGAASQRVSGLIAVPAGSRSLPGARTVALQQGVKELRMIEISLVLQGATND
jgi:hypothetical protein